MSRGTRPNDKYTTVQKFGVTSEMSLFSMKTYMKLVAKLVGNIVKDIDKIINNYFLIETLLSSMNPPFATITALQTFGILVVNLLRSSEEISPHASLQNRVIAFLLQDPFYPVQISHFTITKEPPDHHIASTMLDR